MSLPAHAEVVPQVSLAPPEQLTEAVLPASGSEASDAIVIRAAEAARKDADPQINGVPKDFVPSP